MSTSKQLTTNWYTGPTFRGVDYSPTWPNWVVGPGTQLGDSDFANDAFQSLWSNAYVAAPANDPSVPVNNSPNYRNDLGTISAAGFNMIRLYNWDMARGTSSSSNTGLDHINFLNYANTLGLKVVVPVSDYFLSDEQFAWNNQVLANYDFKSAPKDIRKDFTQFINSIIDPSTNQIHTAIHSISVGNEGDIGQGIAGTTASNFLARTIWWILNLHQQINGSGSTGPNGNPVVNGATPVIPFSATISNADQGGGTSSWFQCFVNGVTAGQSTPNGCPLGSTFVTAVTGLSGSDPLYAGYYYNSVNISQVSIATPFSNTLAATMALYDNYNSSNPSWPWQQFEVPLLLMEVFTPNRSGPGGFASPADQATAAIGQVQSLESYLSSKSAGTGNSSTYLMGYNYFEFNDEQDVKLTGLYQYTSAYNNAQTGNTSLSYGSFPGITFPVYTLTPTPGPSLVSSLTALFPGS